MAEYLIRFRDKASLEFEKAYAWYEEQRDGLGEEFAEEIGRKIKKVSINPYHYKKTYKHYHEAVVERFPFIIAFTVKEQVNEIIIVAIFHTSRNPRSKFLRK